MTESDNGNKKEILNARASQTMHRMANLRQRLRALSEVSEKFCVYATGSAARGELSPHSDLDLFLVGGGDEKSVNLELIRVQARLIEISAEAGFPEFDGGGEYLTCHKVGSFTRHLGKRDDNSLNIFTARMLLLLESKVLYGDSIYEETVKGVIQAYWRDYERHSVGFLPIFLCNDILRFWKELCVNYEGNRRDDEPEPKATGKRRLKNYKLKHSRMLTCFASIAYLCNLAERKGSVSPDAVREMVGMTPMERLDRIEHADPRAAVLVREMQEMYGVFLKDTEGEPSALWERFSNSSFYDECRGKSKNFGDRMAELLDLVGRGTPLHRYLLV